MIAYTGMCPVRVGRDRELAQLEDGLAAVVSSGNGRLTLVSGEAGVGKSRLAGEAVRLAEAAGLAHLEGQCSIDASIPYAPFVQAIRRRTRSLDARQLHELFAGTAAFAAALLPEVAAEVGLPPTTPAAEDLYAACWQLLARLVRGGGARTEPGGEGSSDRGHGGLLLLEDLHWADPDSRHLLGSLARELDGLPLWVVGTYRSDEMHRRHPLRELVASLVRERRVDEVSLEPLDREDVRAMMSAIFDGTEVGDEFTDVVLERTGGNPFFVEELSKVLVDRGDVYWQDHDWARRDLVDIQLPESVRETLLARARTLDPDALRVLQLAALAADTLDLPVLARAAGVDVAVIDDVVREGLLRQLLVERRDGAFVRYEFRHALTREAFADELVGPDRRRAHLALAEALAHVHADRLDAVAAELADHYAAADDAPHAYELSLRAARAAQASFADDEADHRYDQALRLRPAHDVERLAVLVEAVGAATVGVPTRMQVAFAREARELARSLGDPVQQARAIRVLVEERWFAGDSAGSLALAAEAAELVRGHDDYVEASMLRELTRRLQLCDRHDEAAALLPRGIELAQASGNLSALSGLYGTRLLVTPTGPEFDTLYQATLDAARRAHDLVAEQNVCTNAGYINLWCGELGRARLALARAQELRAIIAPTDGYAGAGLAWLQSLTGEYEECVRAASVLRADRSIPTRAVALTALYEVAERRGDPEAPALADELVTATEGIGESQRSVPALAAHARATLRADGLDAAIPLFRQALRATVNSLSTGSHWPFSPDLSAALAAEGRVDELRSWVGDVTVLTRADPNPHNVAADGLCTAYLLAASGETAEARAAFVDAADRYGAVPCPARTAEAYLGLADAEWDRGSTDASLRAARRAADLADTIGAPTLSSAAKRAAERASEPPVLATVLFTDIVGSTEMAAALGDHAWQVLLERHHAIVRRELARSRGREIDTAGDGFLIAFETPAHAIRCACAISDGLAQAGILIRAGLHTGECQEYDGKLTGLTVHIAARVSQLAGAREVLVSQTVRDLVTGSGLELSDRGRHELKGVPGHWQVYAVAH